MILIPLVVILLLPRISTDDAPDPSAYPWLYLRDDEPLVPGEQVVEVIAVGDVMLGRGVADEAHPLDNVAPWLRRAHLTVGNLECVIRGDPRSQPIQNRSQGVIRSSLLAWVLSTGLRTSWRSGPSIAESRSNLQATPSAVVQLRDAGFDVLGLANNHALDLGPEGLGATVSRLQAAGMATMGVGPSAEAALQPLVHEVGGVHVALLAFNAVADPQGSAVSSGWSRAEWAMDRASAAVAAAAEGADVVIVSLHWGYEYETTVDPAQRSAARALLAVGADLVVGHHPHVVQPFEAHDDGCVAYSLGNFVFDQGQEETDQGLALRVFVDGQGLRAVQALPVRAGPRPRLMSPTEANALLARVAPLPRRLRFACDDRACHIIDAPPRVTQKTRSGLFWGGRIDLTGDGVAEHVRRVGEQVLVYSDGAEVWRSPPEWRVVDVALGDPNDDGRGELLLALWKAGLDGLETPSPEKKRVPRSHPFIIGYRGGIYRTLWGGSAVDNPIHEVELGDVAGDRAQELVVLEGDESGGRTISVWLWHGWGFSLMWRSGPGPYHDVVLAEDGAISVATEAHYAPRGSTIHSAGTRSLNPQSSRNVKDHRGY